MAEFGRKGGKSGKGDSKRRGDSKFYSELIARRWAKKKGEPKPRKQRRRVLP